MAAGKSPPTASLREPSKFPQEAGKTRNFTSVLDLATSPAVATQSYVSTWQRAVKSLLQPALRQRREPGHMALRGRSQMRKPRRSSHLCTRPHFTPKGAQQPRFAPFSFTPSAKPCSVPGAGSLQNTDN